MTAEMPQSVAQHCTSRMWLHAFMMTMCTHGQSFTRGMDYCSHQIQQHMHRVIAEPARCERAVQKQLPKTSGMFKTGYAQELCCQCPAVTDKPVLPLTRSHQCDVGLLQPHPVQSCGGCPVLCGAATLRACTPFPPCLLVTNESAKALSSLSLRQGSLLLLAQCLVADISSNSLMSCAAWPHQILVAEQHVWYL